MLNRITDAKRREAMALVREGRLYDLSQVLDESNPVFPGRCFARLSSPRTTTRTQRCRWARTRSIG
jgi:hypothetical protein